MTGPFLVILPNQSHKHLGVRIALNGDFSDEKQHVCTEMQARLKALAEDRAFSRAEKEITIKTAVCSVFRYSAGYVDWTRTELNSISTRKMWTRAYKQAWGLPSSMESCPMILYVADGGRGCPSAVILWTREVYAVMEQCVSLPGEISQITTNCLHQQCISQCCYTLNQLQLLLRIRGNAETVLERFLLRLDQQGLEISSPWKSSPSTSLLENLWPRLHKTWVEKERWAGCREIAEEVRSEWDQALLCLKACQQLGSAEPAILLTAHFSKRQHQWMPIEELKHRDCHLTAHAYKALTSWLLSAREQELDTEMPLTTKDNGDIGEQLANPCLPGNDQQETDAAHENFTSPQAVWSDQKLPSDRTPRGLGIPHRASEGRLLAWSSTAN
jgi:hypothetical protein